MQSKINVFILFVAVQTIVLTLYEFNAVDKVNVAVNYGRERWKNSSGIYDFVFQKKKGQKNFEESSNEPGLFASVSESLSNAKQVTIDWIHSYLWKKSVVILPPPSYITGGDIRNHAFAPKITDKNVFLLVLITSKPSSLSRRNVIRKTWAGTVDSKHKTGQVAKSINANPKFGSNVYCVFTVGFSNDANIDEQVESEYLAFGDILRIDKRESYRNLVHKIWGSFGWAISVKPKFILKADDDTYIHLPNLITWLHDKHLPTKLYTGFVHYRGQVYRNKQSRWFVSRSEFPGQYYPNYCAGPFYVFSANVLKQLYDASQRITRFQVEDAYFGLVARSIGLKAYHAGNHFLMDNNLPSTFPMIPDKRLKELSALGHGIDSLAIEFLHDKYTRIKE